MKDETRLQLLTHWIESGHWGSVPEELKDIITKEDAKKVLYEACPVGSKQQMKDIINYKDQILERLRKEKEYKIITTNLQWNKGLVIANISLVIVTIVMAVTSIITTNTISEQLSLDNTRLRIDLERNKPILVFNTLSCFPIPTFEEVGRTETNSIFFIENIGRTPLPYEFEISSDFAEFKLERPFCDANCCKDFSKKCRYNSTSGTPILKADSPAERFGYKISVPSKGDEFNYTIQVFDELNGRTETILTCKYKYMNSTNAFGDTNQSGYIPIN